MTSRSYPLDTYIYDVVNTLVRIYIIQYIQYMY